MFFDFPVTYFYEKEAKNMAGTEILVINTFSRLDYGIYI